MLIDDASSRPDFVYEDDFVAVYVDGPPHDYPERQDRDAAQQGLMEQLGWTVVRCATTTTGATSPAAGRTCSGRATR